MDQPVRVKSGAFEKVQIEIGEHRRQQRPTQWSRATQSQSAGCSEVAASLGREDRDRVAEPIGPTAFQQRVRIKPVLAANVNWQVKATLAGVKWDRAQETSIGPGDANPARCFVSLARLGTKDLERQPHQS